MNRIEERLLIEKYCMNCKWNGIEAEYSTSFFPKERKPYYYECVNKGHIKKRSEKDDILLEKWILRDPNYPDDIPAISICKGKYFKQKED